MGVSSMNLKTWAMATDPVYIGTGGYTIGRVDNTIVRDPVTRIPKIPGSSLAGTWRYYVALYLQSQFRDEFRVSRAARKVVPDIHGLFRTSHESKNGNVYEEQNMADAREDVQDRDNWIFYKGNRYAAIKCAGQDESPQTGTCSDDNISETGHCGCCIVCKGFGYSKNTESWQGMLFFSDLNILLFPVYSRVGPKWITSPMILQDAGLLPDDADRFRDGFGNGDTIILHKKATNKDKGWLNLGWLNLPYRAENELPGAGSSPEFKELLNKFGIGVKDVCIVPDSLISQIINSNLEVRTSVSIDPITGAAKDGALFTSEAIPRATVFYGSIRINDKSMLGGVDERVKDLPSGDQLKQALEGTAFYYETLGIGGMTTRGFGRLKVLLR